MTDTCEKTPRTRTPRPARLVHSSRRLRFLCVALGTLPAVGLSGCRPQDLLWFGAGALIASQFQTTTTEYRCFRDGVEVDCSTLPDFGE